MPTEEELREQIRTSAKAYYVYILSRPCGEPFYVGIGAGLRVFEHEAHARRPSKRSHRMSVVRSILAAGGEVGKEIESWHDTAATAKEREKQLILEIGRRDLGTGPLTNHTAGGDGCVELGPEAREKMRRNAKEYMKDAGHRRRISESLKKWNQAHPELVAEYHARSAAMNRTAAVRLKQSLATRRFREQNPELAALYAKRRSSRMKDPDVRAIHRRIALTLTDRNRALVSATAEFKRRRTALIEECLRLMEANGFVMPKNRTRFRKGRWEKVRSELAGRALTLPSGKASLREWEEFTKGLHAAFARVSVN